MAPEQLAEHRCDLGDGKARIGIAGRREVGLELLHVAGVLGKAARKRRRVFDAQALDDAARIRGGRQPSHEAGRGFCDGWAVPVEMGVTLGVNMTRWGSLCANNDLAARTRSRLWTPQSAPQSRAPRVSPPRIGHGQVSPLGLSTLVSSPLGSLPARRAR